MSVTGGEGETKIHCIRVSVTGDEGETWLHCTGVFVARDEGEARMHWIMTVMQGCTGEVAGCRSDAKIV